MGTVAGKQVHYKYHEDTIIVLRLVERIGLKGTEMKIAVSNRNYRRLLEIKQKTSAESINEVVDWLLDFWYSWQERQKKPEDHNFGYST